MDVLFTRDGAPLGVSGTDVFDRSGRQVARRHGDRLHGPDGAYRATIIGDRVVYRPADNVEVAARFIPRILLGPRLADRPRAGVRGDEPFQVPVLTPPRPLAGPPALTRGAVTSPVLDLLLSRYV